MTRFPRSKGRANAFLESGLTSLSLTPSLRQGRVGQGRYRMEAGWRTRGSIAAALSALSARPSWPSAVGCGGSRRMRRAERRASRSPTAHPRAAALLQPAAWKAPARSSRGLSSSALCALRRLRPLKMLYRVIAVALFCAQAAALNVGTMAMTQSSVVVTPRAALFLQEGCAFARTLGERAALFLFSLSFAC